ncbi:MAG: tellurium resistance protein [Paracoccus sp. (in: a-proteobacteria)]|jgi:tellurite resistance protein|uniref:SLAC1 family transporter n=1 Tax=Paracoccus sp. TaxID=267 RepID=UPI0035AD8A3F
MRFAPVRTAAPGLWRRVPPAIFPPLLGILGLALAWRLAAQRFGLPDALPGMLAGGAMAAWAFATLAYGAKLARRPAVLAEELRILPGRAGVGAALVCIYAAAQILGPFAPAAARILLILGLGAHLIFWAVLIPVLLRVPGQGRVTPAWQLNFVGPIVAVQAAAGFGWTGFAAALWWPMAAAAVLIWALSLRQAWREDIPAPLRPLLVIHVAPVAMLGASAAALGWHGVAAGFAWALVPVLAAIVLRVRWLTEAGFSPFWSAFTFPLAASAGLWLAMSYTAPGWAGPARMLLVVASLVVVPILFLVWKSWAQGRLAVKTNAAIA